MADSVPLLRQWTLLQTLSARRNGVTLREMSNETAVSQKTILRDLQLLRRVGFPVQETVGTPRRRAVELKSEVRVDA